MLTWGVTHLPTTKAPYWVLSPNMKVHKLNDFSYPPQVGGYLANQCYE